MITPPNARPLQKHFSKDSKGPAIIEQMDTTTLIEPDHKVYGDDLGNIFIEVGDF